jgi:hypothetical protein
MENELFILTKETLEILDEKICVCVTLRRTSVCLQWQRDERRFLSHQFELDLSNWYQL